jgi:hypothetical protein
MGLGSIRDPRSGIRKNPIPDPGSKRHTQIDVGDRVLVNRCLVHVTGYEVQGVRVQGGGGGARQVQAREQEADTK